MSEEKEPYIVENNNTKLYWISKKMNDLLKEIDALDEKSKKFVIERVDKKSPTLLADFYNDLNEYMGW